MCRLHGNREKDRSSGCIGDKLTHHAHGQADHNQCDIGIRSTQALDTSRNSRSQSCRLDGGGHTYGGRKNHQRTARYIRACRGRRATFREQQQNHANKQLIP